MKTIDDIYPDLRSIITGEYIKLYTDTDEQRREIIHKLDELKFEYFAITPKAVRPINGTLQRTILALSMLTQHISNVTSLLPPPRPKKSKKSQRKKELYALFEALVEDEEKYSPDIILVQETKLRPTHNIRISNYTCYRKDRDAEGHAHGGTLILIKNSINHFNPPQHPTFSTLKLPWINTFMSDTNFINPNQFGFTRRLSTCHPLLRLTEKITSGFQTNRSTGAVFLDIQKAFNWHNLQSNNLQLPSCSNSHIINSYLTNRSYQVRVKDTLSNSYNVNIGAPQATPSLHVPKNKQVVPSPPRIATPSGTINNYDMGWRLALRAICPATDSDSGGVIVYWNSFVNGLSATVVLILCKARKEYPRLLAEELNLNVGDNMKIADLSKLIITHTDYDEDFRKNQLTIMIEDRMGKKECRKREEEHRKKMKEYRKKIEEYRQEIEELRKETEEHRLTRI
ncbi:hypothetical protein TNCV_927951 [Trichonephila clavipes]|nr:hypothetical protein TNCV_927951 [Trichonephila clavipes]